MNLSTLILILTSTSSYDRSDYGQWKGSCYSNTRTSVLLRDGSSIDSSACKVRSGTWHDPYSDSIFHNPRRVHIDHVLPIRLADEWGGTFWSDSLKQAFYNDTLNLLAVSYRLTVQKGSSPIWMWMPKPLRGKCEYIRRWRLVKYKYGLNHNSLEKKIYSEFLS